MEKLRLKEVGGGLKVRGVLGPAVFQAKCSFLT